MAGDRDTMYGYYAQQEVLPTYGGLATHEDLAAHERQRRRLFTDKLQLPPRLLAGARLLELGPDAGENSLVFALWGARCTLAEPHERAHAVIRDYFARYELDDRLAALVDDDLESYPDPAHPDDRFDLVDAEGFLNAIQPPSRWIDKLRRLVRSEGFAVLFYYEAFGLLLELTWKVVHARFRALTGLGSVDAARTVFTTKWDSIPHKRSIESWTMDVLENPFVRLAYALDAVSLCEQMSRAGFRLYSSWPRYDGGLDVAWFKREATREEELERVRDFVGRSRLSHMLGRRHFLAADAAATRVRGELPLLLESLDALVDGFDGAAAARCDGVLATVADVLTSDAVVSTPEETRQSLATVDMLRRLLEVLAAGDADTIAAFCKEDAAFVASWGAPSHFAVFRGGDD